MTPHVFRLTRPCIVNYRQILEYPLLPNPLTAVVLTVCAYFSSILLPSTQFLIPLLI